MAIVGGGYVAAEFAHVFSALGTEVTQVHRGPALLRETDEDVSARFTELAARQWDVRLDTAPTRVRPADGGIVLSLSDGTDLETDVLLMATGRVANTDRLGLEHTSVKVRGRPHLGRRLPAHHRRRSVGPRRRRQRHQLKHVANLEAHIIQHNLLHPEDLITSDHRFVPSAVFTSPQIANVGLTSQEAREQGIEHLVATLDYADVAYGWAMEGRKGGGTTS